MQVGGRSGDRTVAGVVAALAAALVATCGLAGSGSPAAAAVVRPPDTGAAAAQHAPAKPAVQHRRARHSTLDRALQAKLADRMSRATSGRYGLVVDIEGVGRVASLHPARGLRPASTQKLFTTLPLLLSRPDDSLVTDVSITSEPVAGVVSGDLVVHAGADPSLAKHDLAHLAQVVRDAGVRRVTGRLLLDISSLPLNTRQPGWHRDFVPTDIGPLSPFPIHRDDWRRDASYVANPTAINLQVFRTRLDNRGVKIKGNSVIVRKSPAGTVIASHQSRPLTEMITHTLRWSDNFYAESLLAVAGGHRAVDQVSAAAGVTDTSSATDGSGLSYADRQTARGEVMLLDYAHQSPAADLLVRSLPVGCKSGTLEDRFCHTDGKGEVFAKTGTLSHSSALAGYTTDALGRWVTFSIICGEVRSITAARHAIDRAVLVLRHYND